MIRISPVRLVSSEGEQLGLVDTAEAMRMAQEQGLDLVEVVPDTRPPVCKIMDYGKFKYEQSQKERKQRAASKSQEMKQVRLGRSAKIDPHDVQIRIDQTRRFLMEGHKVQIVQRFRGREMQHKELGLEHLHDAVKQLADVSKVEVPPRMTPGAKEASMILAPDKVKIEAIKRKLEKERAERAAKEGKTSAQIEAEELAKNKAADESIAKGDQGDDGED